MDPSVFIGALLGVSIVHSIRLSTHKDKLDRIVEAHEKSIQQEQELRAQITQLQHQFQLLTPYQQPTNSTGDLPKVVTTPVFANVSQPTFSPKLNASMNTRSFCTIARRLIK